VSAQAVFHPSAGYGHAYSTMGWSGLIGALTGYSSADVAISEKVWLHYTGKSTFAGIPATFLLEVRWAARRRRAPSPPPTRPQARTTAPLPFLALLVRTPAPPRFCA
jgi:hypothetical protein